MSIQFWTCMMLSYHQYFLELLSSFFLNVVNSTLVKFLLLYFRMYVADEYYLKYNEVLYDNFKRVNLIYSLKKKNEH